MDLNDDHSDQLIARYLLGDIDEENRRRLEEQYFDDDQLFERLLFVETRLIQEYVAGKLSREDRERFENHFLTSTARRQKVESAQAAARCGQSPKKSS